MHSSRIFTFFRKTLLGRRPWLVVLLLVPRLSGEVPAKISVNSASEGGVEVSVVGVTNSNHRIEYSTDLSASATWHWLANVRLEKGQASLRLPIEVESRPRFYRSVSSPTNMVWIPPGTFLMGSTTNEALHESDETQHPVTLTRGFWISQHELTVGEGGTNLTPLLPGGFPPFPAIDPRLPVGASWEDATNFCGVFTEAQRASGDLPDGYAYRLPTEAEWEYACRAGTTTAFNFGNSIRQGSANFVSNFEYDASLGTQYQPSNAPFWKSVVVESYSPNAWGLYDAHGNVWEWCADWYGPFDSNAITDPVGPSTGTTRVARGGGMLSAGSVCRSAFRGTGYSIRVNAGFRMVLAPVR